ncbi:MAG TPA: hypothetical protein VMU09_02415, partial [Acidimicrobiales bacterium]|nr:hypothetical protein [Acidimicrobiales bacterium]
MALIALVALVVVGSVVTALLFLWPATDEPAKVDAIVALGGDPGQRRAAYALELAARGYAPTVLVSLGGYPPAPCPTAPRGVVVRCFRANPLDTRGEAEHFASVAAQQRWRSAIVVPERTQTTRARLLFGRCTGVSLRFVPVDDPLSKIPFDVLYEWG